MPGIGLATGAGLSFGLMRVLRFNPAVANLFDGSGVHLDLRAGGIVLLSAVLAITAVWLLLFRYLRRHDYVGAIKEGATAPSRLRAFSLLLATQLGVALLLIAMSASFLRTLWMTIVRDLPFRTDHVELADIDLKSFSWYNDRARGHDFCRTVIDQLRSLPGVTAVGASTTRPLDRAGTTSIILDASSQQEDRRNRSRYTFIGPDFFGALGVRFLQGRDLAETELQQNQPVSVINRSMGSRFWPDEASPVGQTFRPWSGGPVTTVIGVVNDFPGVAPEDPQPQFFLPYTSDTIGRITLAIGAQDDSAAMHKQLAETLAAVWPNSQRRSPSDRPAGPRESERSGCVESGDALGGNPRRCDHRHRHLLVLWIHRRPDRPGLGHPDGTRCASREHLSGARDSLSLGNPRRVGDRSRAVAGIGSAASAARHHAATARARDDRGSRITTRDPRPDGLCLPLRGLRGSTSVRS